MGVTAGAITRALKRMLPPGRLFRVDPDSTWHALFAGIADELLRVDNRATSDLLAEWSPDTATDADCLSDWERVLGLPDPLLESPPSTEELRQVAAAARYTARGGQSRQYMINLADGLGLLVTVSDGVVAHYWTMLVDLRENDASLYRISSSVFRSGASRSGDRIGSFGIMDLENVVRRANPAQAVPWFDYSALALSGTWTSRTIPAGTYRGVCWSESLSLFVAVGSSLCATSPDGITWTARSYALSGLAVTWSESLALFVSVGTSSCGTSPDGITWTSRTIPAGTYRGVCWSESLSLFVAVGDSGACATSPDGITWTPRTISGNYRSVTWGSTLGLFVAVGGNACSTSADGITWTSQTISAGTYYAVTWSPWLRGFVAIGNSVCAFSDDGTVWFDHDVPAGIYYACLWSDAPAQFVAVGNGVAASSYDGQIWDEFTLVPALNAIAAAENVPVVVGVGSSNCYTNTPA